MIKALNILLDNIHLRFSNKVYRQIVGIPMGTNCGPLIANLFLYCYEAQFMAKLSKDPSKFHLIDKFNNTYRYPDDIFSFNKHEFSKYTTEIYPKELTLNKVNVNSNKCPFLDLDIYNLDEKLYTKINKKKG